jgi:RecA-family ATPase
MCTTTAWDHLVEAVLDLKVRLLVLDTAADVFGGNENDRQQVRRFIALLTKLAIDIKGAVVVTAHPSRDGLRTGNLDGGNTAWNNSFRSRLTLDFVADAPDTRLLKRKKSNYAPVGDEIRLQWHNGLLLPEGTIAGSSPISQATQAKLAEVVFLDLLDRCTVSNIYVSHLSRASNYAPKLFADCPDRQGLTKRHFEPAMQSLFAQKKIHVVDYGRKSDARQRIDRAPQYAGEPTERTP